MEASLESLQNIDMMDVSVLEEAEVENSSAPDFGDDGTDSILDSLCDSKEYVAAQLSELPAQLTEHAVGNTETCGMWQEAQGSQCLCAAYMSKNMLRVG